MKLQFELPSTLEAKIAQLITVRIGSNLPPAKRVDDDLQRVADLLGHCPIGGLVLFNGVWPSTRTVLDELQAMAEIPLLVGADIERGCGQQMHGMGILPHAMAFHAAGRGDADQAARLASEFGRVTAAEAKLAGIHVAFAPVADTNTNPNNPIIATRAFGTNPAAVASLVAAFVRGCESMGVASTAKHFPGHGDTQQDSHDCLPVVARDRQSIATTELPAFVAAIEAGCSMMMTAHVAYPAIDPTGTPATVSYDITTRLLRDELGFAGVVCSDSMLMSGVRDRYESEGELCLAALNAGVDLLLDVESPEAVVDHLCNAVRNGSLDEGRIGEALDRVVRLKRRVCNPQAEASSFEVARQQTTELGRRVALAAITPSGKGATARLDRQRGLAVLLAKPFATPLDPPEQPLAAAIREYWPDAAYFELGPTEDRDAVAVARQAALASEQLLLAMIVKPAAWHKFGLIDYQQRLFHELAALPKSVLVSLGVDTIFDTFPEAPSKLCAYSDIPDCQRAVVQYLVGPVSQAT